MTTGTNFYEVTFITRPDVATTQVDAVTQKISDVITKQDGKIIKTEQWGLRNLAYRLKKYKKGYYTMLGIQAPGESLAEIERNLKYTDDIIRFTSVKVEELTEDPSIMMKFKARSAETDEEFEAA